MIPAPEPPETRYALLPSEGYRYREGQRPRITRHVYVGVEVAKDHVGKPGWAQRFRCMTTGAIRTWGFCGNRHDSDEDGDGEAPTPAPAAAAASTNT